MDATDLRPKYWHSETEPSRVASELVALCDALQKEFEPLHALWGELLGMFEPREGVTSLDSRSYLLATDRGTGLPVAKYPAARSLVDTVVADIAGRQRPKPLFMTSGADWKTKRTARKLGRFACGQMALKQGKYLDAWDCVTDGFAGCSISGMSFVYVYGDADDGRVQMERVRPTEILWDPEDAQSGEPSNLFRVRWVDEDELHVTYVDDPLEAGEIDEQEAHARRLAIAAAPSRDAGRADSRRLAPQKKVYAGWLRRRGKRPGRHCIAVAGCLLADAEWDRDDFPFLIQRWAHEREGFGGIGLIEECRTMALELDEALAAAQSQHKLNSGRRVFVDGDSVADEDLEANYEETIIHVNAGAKFPQETAVQAINPSTLQWVQLLRSFIHEGCGVSQMAAQGRKEPGANSGVAIRTMIDVATKRFAVKAKAYENSYIRLAQLIVRAVQDLVDQGVKVRSSFPGEEFWDDLEWSDVALDESLYTIQIDVVSASADRAAGRIATMEESLQSGMISAEAFSRIVPPGGTLDLENEAGPVTKQQRYLEALIERYLDAEESDPDFQFEGPDGFIMDLPGSVGQFVGAYFDAKLSRTPEFNLQLLRDYISELDRLVQKAAQAQMAAQQATMPQPAPGPGPAPMPQPQAA